MKIRITLLGAAAVLLAGCNEATRESVLVPTTEARVTTAGLVFQNAAGNDSTTTVTVRLTSGASVGRIGSMTAAIDFDTTAIQFVRDDSPSDGVMRAMNADRGRLKLAIASASGVESEVVARMRFRVRNADALREMKLSISELHQVDATNIVGGVKVLPTAGNR